MLLKQNVLKYNLMLSFILLSLTIILLFEQPIYHVIAFWLIVLVSLLITKFEFSHPIVWFSGSFALYSTSYALMYILDYQVSSGYTKNNLLLPFIGLSIVMLVIGVKKRNKINFKLNIKTYSLSNQNNKLILHVYFKHFFVRGEVKESIEDQPLLYNFLSSDFSAAGENLQVLLNNSWTNSYHGFSVILSDFVSPFFPSGIFTNLDLWFNNTFYSNSYSRAFTVVGEGYVVGGLLGIVLIFLILAIWIKFIYIKSSHHIYWLVIYIYTISTVISAFRGTLSTLFTGTLRVVLLSIAIHLFLNLLINSRHKVNKQLTYIDNKS